MMFYLKIPSSSIHREDTEEADNTLITEPTRLPE
jgi:hypothetical protein